MKGRTRKGRLRALDDYLLGWERGLLEGRLLDVGVGVEPWTTLELAAAARTVNPAVEVVGLERDPASVTRARAHERAGLRFVEGGFDSLASLGPASVVRAMNVLRGYRMEEVDAAHELLGAPLIEGGLLLEGSSDPEGAVLVAHLMRKRAGRLEREALLFHTDFSRGFAPLMFRDWLPRDLRRRVKPGHRMHDFFGAWTGAWEKVRALNPAEAFSESWRALEPFGAVVDPRLLALGDGLWRPAGGVPRGE